MISFSLPKRSQVGSAFQASQWQKCALLIDGDEMEALLTALQDFWMIKIAGVIPLGQERIDQQDFLDGYASYIQSLKGGALSFENNWRSLFSSIWTVDLTSVYSVPLDQSKGLVKIERPVIQLQRHRVDYSEADGTFRSQVFGEKSIDWGIQFSYPSLYQDANFQIFKVREGDEFPNTALFKRLQRWVRAHTIPTSFERRDQRRVNLSIRLGKRCVSWINTYPPLRERGLVVSHSYSQ